MSYAQEDLSPKCHGRAYNRDMILDDIKNYAKQFDYEPKVENAAKLASGSKKHKKFCEK